MPFDKKAGLVYNFTNRNRGLTVSECFISKGDFSKFVEGILADSRVIAPIEHDQNNILQEIASEDIPKINLSGYRAVESFKSYFFRVVEKVSSYFGADEPIHGEKFVLLGARGCDLEAIEVLDRIYLEGDFVDPYYAANRSKILIIGADCTDCGETCFCNMVKGQPYPAKLFDLNLSPIDDGYVVEIGSEKGRKLVEGFREAAKDQLEKKAKNRQKVTNCLAENNSSYHLKLDLSETHKRNLENKAWKVLTKDCVECSACNLICPTCSCFLLIDTRYQIPVTSNQRYKIWDACLKCGYAKVAGGANPRGKLYQRLQNRYHCKFDYSFDRLNRYICVGCGRCIDGCAGKIDMRKVFVELEKQVPLTAKLE